MMQKIIDEIITSLHEVEDKAVQKLLIMNGYDGIPQEQLKSEMLRRGHGIKTTLINERIGDIMLMELVELVDIMTKKSLGNVPITRELSDVEKEQIKVKPTQFVNDFGGEIICRDIQEVLKEAKESKDGTSENNKI